MSDISDTEKLDALERIRIGLDFLEMFVDKKGKLNVTAMREKFEQYEARIAELERIGEIRQDIVEILESRIHEAIEVYAGMEGFIPETAPEAYCLRIIDQMNKALLGGGENG